MVEIFYMKILFGVVFMISEVIFLALIKYKSKNIDGLIASGGVSLSSFIGLIILYFIQ